MVCLFTDAAGKVAMKENATCEDIDIKVIFLLMELLLLMLLLCLWFQLLLLRWFLTAIDAVVFVGDVCIVSTFTAVAIVCVPNKLFAAASTGPVTVVLKGTLINASLVAAARGELNNVSINRVVVMWSLEV